MTRAVRIDYERRDPGRPRPSFWKSDAGGFVAMAIWLVGFVVAAGLLKIILHVL